MDTIVKLFNSAARVKLLRLFLFNRNEAFTFSTIVERAKVTPEAARSELNLLVDAGVLKRGGKSGKIYRTDLRYEHLESLDGFIRTTTIVRPTVLLASLKKAGALRLVVLTGFFTGVGETAVDLLLVGDRLDERALARTAASLEAELGREVRYTSFSVEDFRYRQGIYDRLLRDVFDYPHRVLLDKVSS